MSHSVVNPVGLHDPVGFGYSHVVAAGGLVFVAGQYGSDSAGQVVSADFSAQVVKSLENLGAALEAVGLDFSHVVRIGTYVVGHDADKLAVIAARVGEVWGDRPPAQTLVGVAALALPEMLFEIDAVAVGG